VVDLRREHSRAWSKRWISCLAGGDGFQYKDVESMPDIIDRGNLVERRRSAPSSKRRWRVAAPQEPVSDRLRACAHLGGIPALANQVLPRANPQIQLRGVPAWPTNRRPVRSLHSRKRLHPASSRVPECGGARSIQVWMWTSTSRVAPHAQLTKAAFDALLSGKLPPKVPCSRRMPRSATNATARNPKAERYCFSRVQAVRTSLC